MAFTDHAPTPIAQLNPQLPSQTTTVRGVVTVVWPYSSTTSSLSFTLAEPEYRLRRPKGQIRVSFVGHVAKAVSCSGIKSGDELALSLDGVEWEAAETNRRLSGMGHEWQLQFSQKLRLQAKLDETGETKDLEIDRPSDAPAPSGPVQAPAITPTPDMEFALPASLKIPPAKSRSLKRLADGEFASPAFIKRAQVSYGALFEDGFDIFEDALGMFEEDGGARGKGRKRARFGHQSGAWRYTTQSSPSPSPEPEPVPEVDTEPAPEPEPQPQPETGKEAREEEAIEGFNSSKPSPSQPQRSQMTDEGCQTMEIDLPSPPSRFGASTDSLHLYQPTGNADGFLDQGHQTATSSAWGLPPTGRELPRTEIGLSISDEERRPHFAHAIDLDMNVAGSQMQQHWSPQIPEVDPNLDSTGPGAQPSNPATMLPPEHLAGASSNLSAVRFGFGVPEVMPQYDAMESNPHQHHHDLNYPPLEMQTTASTDFNQAMPQNPFAAPVTTYYPEPESEPNVTSMNPFLAKPVQNAPSSWASVNNATSSHPVRETRSASTDGQSPDTALVIDNSDTEADTGEMELGCNTTEPASFEADQELQSDHPEWNVVEGDDYENEVDAQYSDDDEPEYDDNEKGGDYDTRNYIGPNDDEDDSHDEDLKPHPLEPEFDDGGDDGEEWDEDEDQLEEDEDELNYDDDDEEEEEEDEENAMDLDTPLQQRQAPPSSKAAPVIIDLLSSDDEDDNEQIPQPTARTNLTATHQSPVATQNTPSSPQYGSENEAEDVEVEEIISDDISDNISDDISDDEDESEENISEVNVEDEEIQPENDDSQEQDAHMKDAQDEIVDTVVTHSPVAKSGGPIEDQEETATVLSPGESNRDTDQAGKDLEAPKVMAVTVDDDVLVPNAGGVTGGAQPAQRYSEPKHEVLDDSDLDRAGREITSSIATGGIKGGLDDEMVSTPHQTVDEPPEMEISHQVANIESDKGQTDAISIKNEGNVDGVTLGTSQTILPPTESNLLNQLDDKLEPAAKQTRAATQSKTSGDQLLTPLDSQLVDHPQMQEPRDETPDSDEDMVMEAEEVVTAKATTVEQTREYISEASELATTVETVSKMQASASTEISEPAFETQIPYLGPVNTTAPDRLARLHYESDTQMDGSNSPLISPDTFDDDALQSTLRGEDDDEEDEEDIQQEEPEEEEEEEEEEEDDENLDDESLQAVLREEDEDEEMGEAEEEEDDGIDDDSLQAALLEEEEEGGIDDDSLQATLLEEEEKVEGDVIGDDSLQAALHEEEGEGEDGLDDDSLQAALHKEENEEETEEAEEAEAEEKGSHREDNMVQITPHANDTSMVAILPSSDKATAPLSATARQDMGSVQAPSDQKLDQDVEKTVEPSSTPRQECSHQHGHGHGHGLELEHAEPTRTPAAQLDRPRSRGRPSASVETSDDSFMDPSVRLARASVAGTNEDPFTDPSVRLARASIASRRASRKRDVTPESTRPHTRSMCFQMSPDYKGDESVRLAKAAFNYSSMSTSKSSSRAQSKAVSTSPAASKFGEELDPLPGVKAKIRRHLRDSVPEYTELKVLRHHIGKSIGVMAVALMSPADPQRAKGGPREYMMSFTVTDHSIGPNAAAEVLLYRPHKDSLPKVKAGDIVLLRNFTVLSLKGKDYGLRTNDASSWAIFDTEDEPAQIRGPPVEYGEGEITQVAYLREWYRFLNANSRSKLERANQKIINAGRASK